MPKKPAPKLRPDVAETAFRVMREATGQAPKTVPGQGEKNPEAVRRGKLGGEKGGPARAERLTKDERRLVAEKGAVGRWGKKSD